MDIGAVARDSYRTVRRGPGRTFCWQVVLATIEDRFPAASTGAWTAAGRLREQNAAECSHQRRCRHRISYQILRRQSHRQGWFSLLQRCDKMQISGRGRSLTRHVHHNNMMAPPEPVTPPTPDAPPVPLAPPVAPPPAPPVEVVDGNAKLVA